MDKKNFSLADRKGDMSKQWYVYWYHGKKRKQLSGNINRGKTPEERRALAAAFIEKLELNPPEDAPDTTPPIIRDMENVLQRKGWHLRNKSIATYSGKIKRLRLWMQKHRIREITPVEANRFMAYLRNDQGLHVTTLKAFQMTFDWLYTRMKKPNPFADIRKFRADKRPAMHFTLEECQKLKKIIKEENPQLWLTCELLFYCFIRPNEMRFIKIEDINLTTNKINIHGENSKNGKGQMVAIPNALRPSLLALGLQQYKSNWYLFGKDNAKPGPEPVFHSWFCRRHQGIIKAHGYNVGAYKHYSWKHSGAVAFITGSSASRSGNAAKRLKQLQIQMRHHSIAQTDQYLRSLGVDDLDELIDEFPTL